MARHSQPHPYPRYPLREFTPCAPGRCIQQDFQVSSGIEPSIQCLQCDFHPRMVIHTTTDLADLTDNMRSRHLNKYFPHPCDNLSHSSRSARNSQLDTPHFWRTVTAGKAGGYVIFGCGFAAPGHPRHPWCNAFYSRLIAHRLIVFVRNRIHVAEAVRGPVSNPLNPDGLAGPSAADIFT